MSSNQSAVKAVREIRNGEHSILRIVPKSLITWLTECHEVPSRCLATTAPWRDVMHREVSALIAGFAARDTPVAVAGENDVPFSGVSVVLECIRCGQFDVRVSLEGRFQA